MFHVKQTLLAGVCQTVPRGALSPLLLTFSVGGGS